MSLRTSDGHTARTAKQQEKQETSARTKVDMSVVISKLSVSDRKSLGDGKPVWERTAFAGGQCLLSYATLDLLSFKNLSSVTADVPVRIMSDLLSAPLV